MLWWYVAALDVVWQKLGHYFAKYVADYCHFCRKRSLLFLSRCWEKDSLKLVEHLVTVQILLQEFSIFVYANMFVDGIEEGMYAFFASWEVLLTFFLLSVSQIIQWKVSLLGWHFFIHWCSPMPAKVCLLEWHFFIHWFISMLWARNYCGWSLMECTDFSFLFYLCF